MNETIMIYAFAIAIILGICCGLFYPMYKKDVATSKCMITEISQEQLSKLGFDEKNNYCSNYATVHWFD